VLIDSSWWIFRKGTSQLVDFSEKHFAAGGFLLGGIGILNKKLMENQYNFYIRRIPRGEDSSKSQLRFFSR